MRRLLALPLIAVVALLAAGVSNAGREQMTLTCGGYGTLSVTVTTTKNDHSVAWGTGKVSNPRLLGIPVSFSGAFIDLSTNTGLFSFTQAKGKVTACIASRRSPAPPRLRLGRQPTSASRG